MAIIGNLDHLSTDDTIDIVIAKGTSESVFDDNEILAGKIYRYNGYSALVPEEGREVNKDFINRLRNGGHSCPERCND